MLKNPSITSKTVFAWQIEKHKTLLFYRFFCTENAPILRTPPTDSYYTPKRFPTQEKHPNVSFMTLGVPLCKRLVVDELIFFVVPAVKLTDIFSNLL